MRNEIWRPITFCQGKKEISSFGRVRNAITNRVLKTHISKNGYVAISFWVGKKNKSFKIHRLVAEYFLPWVEGKHHVNHKDFDKQNNHVSNLEWCTQKENISHYFSFFKHKINPEQVLYIRQNIDKIGMRKLASDLNITEGYVLSVANGTFFSNIHIDYIREKQPSAPVKVEKFTLAGELVETYGSISEAARENGTKLSKIQQVLSGECKSYKGFVYRSEQYKQTKIKRFTNKKAGRKVIKMDLEGRFICEFKTIREAASSVPVSPSAVRDGLNGRYKTAGGFKWKYSEAQSELFV